MRWPGRIPAGSRCSKPAMTIDILPTIAELIGADLPNHKIDGKNIWPLIAGEENAESSHAAYYFYYGEQLQAIRSGKWKLHFPHQYRTMAGRPGGTGGIPTKYSQAKIGRELFDLASDIGETTNVADQHPDVVERLSELGAAMRRQLGDENMKGAGIREAGRL